jgi:hypothetical protein
MITITVRPKRNSREDLRREFNKYSVNEDDFNEWLTAMQITGQLEERRGYFIPSKTPEVEEKAVAQYRTFEARLYRGKKEAEVPELGIRELWEERKRYYPTEMQIIGFEDEKGKLIPIPEKLKFTFSRARERYDKEGNLIQKGEKWRANLPIEITRKYGLKIGTPVRIKIGSVSKKYFQTLKLWGYAIESMVSFGETAGRQNVRDLELHGWDFPFETNGKILAELGKVGAVSIDVMNSWLATFDMDYARLLKSCRDAGTTTEASPPIRVEGEALYRPFSSPPRRQVKIQLYDHDAKTVKPERATVYGKLPRNWHEMDPDEIAVLFSFASPSDDRVGNAKGYHGRKQAYRKLRTKQMTLEQLKSGKEGEGFKK